ncbi:MAG: hypothetical protein HYY84_19035 [Deltaproteobacteria bacterium]|nr:hypothetical protein [Deltaproteobacteria bacterium]
MLKGIGRFVVVGALGLGFSGVVGCKSDVEKKCDEIISKEMASAPAEMRGLVEAMKPMAMNICKTLPADKVECMSKEYKKANKEKCADVEKKMAEQFMRR